MDEDIWYQKLLLPTLDNIPPIVLCSILNHWYESRTSVRRDFLKCLFVTEHEVELLNFLKDYTIHSVLAGGIAAVAANQKPYQGNAHVYIPVYGNLDQYFIPTLQNMIAKADINSIQTSQSPGLKNLLSFSHQTISNQSKKQMKNFYSQQKEQGKRVGRKFIEFVFASVQVTWIEVPIVPSSLFVKRVPLRALFIFYLLAGTFDINISRIAILNWKNDPIKVGDIYLTLHATEMLHVIYRLPGYDNYILRPECGFYKIAHKMPRQYLEKENPKYYKKKYLHFEEERKHLTRYSNYYYAAISRVRKYPNYHLPSLTNLCLCVLVSLSDLSWVKFKQIFPNTTYSEFTSEKREMLQKIHLM